MSDIKTQSLLVILCDEEMALLVGSRIYPMRLPPKATLPAIVYQQISNSAINSIDGDSGLDNIRMQFTCWARTYEAAISLSVALRRVITSSPTLKAITAMELDVEDPDTRNYGSIIDFYMWSTFSPTVISTLAKFLRVTFDGDSYTTEIDLAYPIAEEGFYLVTLNGKIAQETTEFTINPARNKITFVNPLTSGAYKDEGIIIYQPTSTSDVIYAQFERVEYEGDDVITGIDLPSAIVTNGFYLVTLNGRIAKEGASYEYTLNAARNKIVFNTPLRGGDYKDEGIIIYQKI